MAQSLIQAELLAACSGLGYNDGIRYHKEAECLETVKDLIRYLRKDNDGHEIRRAIGETKVLQTDLIPIIKYYNSDKELFDVTLRLLVNLTNPVMLLFNEEMPEEKITRQQYLQMAAHQHSFKAAFADEVFWNILVTRLGDILQQEPQEREEEDKLVVERILILVRNILSVASSPEDEKRTDDDASVHDQVLWALHLARFEDLILFISSSSNEQDLYMHIIEIISLMLKEQVASQLAKVELQRSKCEKVNDDWELGEMRKQEAILKKEKFQKHYSSRHSRFGGTYYVKNLKSISDNDVISHRHLNDINALNFDECKHAKKIPKNRLPLKDLDKTRRSTFAIRLFLQQLCVEFLNGSFNSLIYVVKENLKRARAQEHDESYYLWAIQFFLEFNRNHNFKVEFISETVNIETFHYIQMQLDTYYETMTTDRKKIPHWSKRMHKALKAYQELLLTLSCMDNSKIPSVQESSRILKCKLFYVIEYRELVLILLQNFDELKMTKTYLKDLVETTHVFLKLLENFCGKQKHLIVQSKAKKVRRKKKGGKSIKSQKQLPSTEELNNIWRENIESISTVLRDETNYLPQVMPYDPVSTISEEEQKELAMKKINALLRKLRLEDAVSLFRSARNIWPEGDIFGAQGNTIEEELGSLEMIFLANINPVDLHEEVIQDLEEDEFGSEDEEAPSDIQLSEQEFSVREYIRRFSHTKVIQAYSILFRDFIHNKEHTNHCLLKMFHRLAWDCKLPAIFFQASIFRTFQRMLNGSNSANGSQNDAIKFIKYILRKFFEVAKSNDKVFLELLFWKTNKDAVEIECGYGTEDSKKSVAAWSEEEEDELRRLYMEFSNKSLEDEDSDKDLVDLLSDNLINQNHSRRAIIKKLKELGLISNIKEISRKPVKTRIPKEFNEEENLQLTQLVSKYKESMNPIGQIMANLTIKRPKHRVVDQLLSLGLINDKSELKKKKTSRKNEENKKSRNVGERFVMANEICESSSEDGESENEVGSQDSICRSTSLLPHGLGDFAMNPDIIHTVLDKVRGSHRKALQWIIELLNETAQEREADGDFEPIPLLAVSESCSDALEDPDFTQLLIMIGLQEPQTHHEIFWRIPASLSISGLKKRVHFLTANLDSRADDAVHQEHQDSDDKSTRQSPSQLADDDDDGVSSKKVKLPNRPIKTSPKMEVKRTKRLLSEDAEDVEGVLDDITNKKVRVSLGNDVETDSDDDNSEMFIESPLKCGKVSRLILSDSEDEGKIIPKKILSHTVIDSDDDD